MGQGKKINADTIFRHISSLNKFLVLLAHKCCQQVAIKILSCWKVMLASVSHAFCRQAIKLTGLLVILSGWIEEGGRMEFGLRLPEAMDISAHKHNLQGPGGWGFPGSCWQIHLLRHMAVWRIVFENLPVLTAFYCFSTKTGSMCILYKYTGLYWRMCLICTFQFFAQKLSIYWNIWFVKKVLST